MSSLEFTHGILPEKPRSEDAAGAKALINFLMEDQFFLALYRSNDPKVRATAMDQLNEAHYQAYGPANDNITSDGSSA